MLSSFRLKRTILEPQVSCHPPRSLTHRGDSQSDLHQPWKLGKCLVRG
jgi:hypothetical protein